MTEKAPERKVLSDWSGLPTKMYVVSAIKADAVVYEASMCSVPMAIGPEVEYTRTDLSNALVAAAYEDAAEWCTSHTMDSVVNAKLATHGGAYTPGEFVSGEFGGRHQGLGYADAIRSRTPADAIAARDARDRQMREEGRPSVDRLAQIIRQVDGNNTLGAGALAEAILALIERETDHDG